MSELKERVSVLEKLYPFLNTVEKWRSGWINYHGGFIS